MRSPMDENTFLMDENTFLNFYKNTVINCSKSVLKNICRMLEEQQKISFDPQHMLGEPEDILRYDSRADFKKVIADTTVNKNFAGFYEHWEFTKLYKYSLPLFYEVGEGKSIGDLLAETDAVSFDPDNYAPECVLDTTLKDAKPLFWMNGDEVFVKFVLQKAYAELETQDWVDYRYPIVIYINQEKKILEIRYDAMKYNSGGAGNMLSVYQGIVTECIDWLKKNLLLELYVCNHAKIIEIINDKANEDVSIFRQMMQLSTGASADLTASEEENSVLPFIGELRELIDENEEAFNKAEDVKKILLQYLEDKEATASYPYIYVKWKKPVESDSFIVKLTFEYFLQKYTLLQHITGTCKCLGMERMNDAIKYLCQSGAFVKGEKI